MPATCWRELIRALASAWLTRFNPAHFNEPSDRRVECAWAQLDVREGEHIGHNCVTVFLAFGQTSEDKQLSI